MRTAAACFLIQVSTNGFDNLRFLLTLSRRTLPAEIASILDVRVGKLEVV